MLVGDIKQKARLTGVNRALSYNRVSYFLIIVWSLSGPTETTLIGTSNSFSK